MPKPKKDYYSIRVRKGMKKCLVVETNMIEIKRSGKQSNRFSGISD